MPWIVVEEGGQYCVYREGADGKPAGNSRGCHRTREEARQQQAALYAAEARQEEGKAAGFKSLGDAGWMGWFSNIFWDRDVLPDAPRGERFTLEALKEYAGWANSDSCHLPELWFWHLQSVRLGKARSVQVVGPFAVAIGEWDNTDTARKARDYIESTGDKVDWAMSHGFGYEPEDRVGGEYSQFRTHEVTVLPRTHAANQVTFFGGAGMAKKSMLDELRQTLQEMFGIPESEAGKIIEDARKGGEPQPGSEIKHKDTGAESAPDDEHDVSDDELALAAAEALIALGDEQEKTARLEAELAATKEAFDGIKDELGARIKALEDTQADAHGILPRAIAEAYRRASKHGAPVDKDEASGDVEAMKAAMGNEPDWGSDPLGAHLSNWARAVGIGDE
jgi:hypothetical protein